MASAASQEVWLARPGELIVSRVEELATRIGGRPLYPAGCPAVAPDLTACQACGNQLALVLQVGLAVGFAGWELQVLLDCLWQAVAAVGAPR